jgi:hypothetical protein
LVRNIRNKFAHQSLSLDFRDAEITAWCGRLHYHFFDRYEEYPQAQFLVCVIAVATMMETMILEGSRLEPVSDWPANVQPEMERRSYLPGLKLPPASSS